MKILYYSPHPNLNLSDPAGYGTHMREMIAAFRSLGHEVLPVIMGGTEASQGPPAKSSLIKSVAKKLISKRKWQTMKDQRLWAFDEEANDHLEEKIKEFQPDLIYERGNYMQVSGVRAAKALGVWHVMEMNSPYTEEKLELEGESDMRDEAEHLEYEQLDKSNHIVAVSTALKEYFMDKHDLLGWKFSVLPNAINPEQIEVDNAKVTALREKYDLGDRKVAGWVGSIQPWHGVDRLIEAFCELDSDDSALLIVGSGETIEEMKALATEKGAGKKIVFTGYVPHSEVYAHIELMDLCVLANTKWYCSPIKIFEYGVMGKAVVATNHSAVLDVMTPDRDGLIVEPTKEALKGAMKRLLADAELREQLGNTFREKILRRHTWEANARHVVDIWESENAKVARK